MYNKDLSTSRLFYKSVPDDKHGNTQYVKEKYNNCCKLKYILTNNNTNKAKPKKALLLSKASQHTNSTK